MDNDPGRGNKTPNSEYEKWQNMDVRAAKPEVPVSNPAKEREAMQEDTTYSPITDENKNVIADIEGKLYSVDTLQYGDGYFLQEILDEPESEKYSFIIESDGQPVGYCMAHEDDSMSDPDFEGKTVYIDDFGVTPEARQKDISIALRAFFEFMKRAERNGVDLIEMEARKDTSYPFFKSPYIVKGLARRGYIVTDHGVSDEGWSDGDVTYLISLRKQPNQAADSAREA